MILWIHFQISQNCPKSKIYYCAPHETTYASLLYKFVFVMWHIEINYVCDHRRIFGSKSSNIDQLTDNSIAEPTTGPVNWVAARRDDYFTNWTRIARSDDNLTSRDCSVSWSHDQQRACSLRGSRDRLIDRQSEGDPISSFPIRTKTIIWSFIVINL